MQKLWIFKIRYLILFLVVIIFTFGFTCFSLPLFGDEVWNAGFSYNISKGMVIYRDFNVLQTPLYFFFGSVFISLFGNYLISLHLMDAIIIAVMLFMLFKILNWKVLIIYPFILFRAIPSYNLLCLFWLFLILYLIHEKRDNNVVLGIIIGLLFLTKQNVGICVFLVYILSSKNKIKGIASFLLPIFCVVIYLIAHDAFYNFLDYCFWGMIDFGEKNNNFIDTFLVFFEFLVIIYLGCEIFKSNFKDISLYYILVFQMMLYPIVDLYHFLLSFVPVVFWVLRERKISFKICLLFFCMFCYLFVFIPDFDSINKERNFFYLRKEFDFVDMYTAYSNYKEKYDYRFFCFTNAYIYKLHMNLEINKYDFMSNGNMGYNGSRKYINEINNICKKNSCVFFIDEDMYELKDTQFSKEIYDYIINTYKKREEYSSFSVYVN